MCNVILFKSGNLKQYQTMRAITPPIQKSNNYLDAFQVVPLEHKPVKKFSVFIKVAIQQMLRENGTIVVKMCKQMFFFNELTLIQETKVVKR